jgi:hypothetical protein
MSCILDSLTSTHGEVGLPTSTAQRGGLRKVSMSGDLSDQVGSRQQEASLLLNFVSLGRMTRRLALSQAPEHVEGKDSEPPGFATHMLALAKPPSMSRGEGKA